MDLVTASTYILYSDRDDFFLPRYMLSYKEAIYIIWVNDDYSTIEKFQLDPQSNSLKFLEAIHNPRNYLYPPNLQEVEDDATMVYQFPYQEKILLPILLTHKIFAIRKFAGMALNNVPIVPF